MYISYYDDEFDDGCPLMMGLQNVTSNADARSPFHFLPVGSARHRFNKLKREIINVPLYDVYTLFLCAACVSCYTTHTHTHTQTTAME